MIKQLFSIGIALSLFSQMLWAQWTPVGDRIKTSWAEKIDVNNVLPEYPRPIMERSEWSNLNGLWKYAVLRLGNPMAEKLSKMLGQAIYEAQIGTREQFRKRYGESYL